MKVLTVVGARPQFIKAGPVSAAIERAGLHEVLVHTGQHHDEGMSDVFFQELRLTTPHHNLGVHGGAHGEQTGRMLIELERVVLQEAPDVALVYGDTNSTLAGALVAAKLHIPIAHVEAGLRSFDRTMPEEINRIVTDHVSTLLFAPTANAMMHLANEGIAAGVILTGDVMFDAALMYAGTATDHTAASGPYVLVTIHRAASTDSSETLHAILSGLRQLAAAGLRVIWPLHPRTRACIERFGLTHLLEGLDASDPVGYLEMNRLTAGATVVVTDSGGLQKEAYFHGVPCVTMRDTTEWVELVDLGWNVLLAPESADEIASTVLRVRGTTGRVAQPYGDGHAADTIANALVGLA
jgi:UDP-GlcNAc3NAcA epimerase